MNSAKAVEMIQQQGARLAVRKGGFYVLQHSSFRNGSRKLSSVTGNAVMNRLGVRYSELPRTE